MGAHALRKTPYLQIRICYASAVYLGRKFWFTAFFLVLLILTNRFDAFNPKNASETNAIIQITLRQLEKRTSSRATDRCGLRGRAGHTIILYDIFPDFFVKFVFLQQQYCSQYNRAAKTRLTANGKPPEPKLVRTCSLSYVLPVDLSKYSCCVWIPYIKLVLYFDRSAATNNQYIIPLLR